MLENDTGKVEIRVGSRVRTMSTHSFRPYGCRLNSTLGWVYFYGKRLLKEQEQMFLDLPQKDFAPSYYEPYHRVMNKIGTVIHVVSDYCGGIYYGVRFKRGSKLRWFRRSKLRVIL